MIVAAPKETCAGERRVAIVPAVAAQLVKLGLSAKVEAGAGEAAGFSDRAYEEAGAAVAAERTEAFDADVVVQVRCYGANPERGGDDLEHLRPGQIVIGHAEPLTAHKQIDALAEKGVTLFAMELIPRITRAQSMDALSSQANLAGYKAVILAADTLPKMFPLMMTAAGTIQPARVFVVGAGVAGLQAIATAKRLGALVSAIDVRPEVKEQVESLGARFVAPPEAAAGEGGYAAEQTEEQKRRQQQLMAETVAESDVVITTAAVPGRRAPVLVSGRMVESMKPRSVIVDLAAERGGNCELTEPGRVVEKHGVTIIGESNVPALLPHDASQMYARNIAALLKHLVRDGKIELDMADEITSWTVVCRDGRVVHPRVREAMGLEPLPEAEAGGAGASGEGAGAGSGESVERDAAEPPPGESPEGSPRDQASEASEASETEKGGRD